MKVRPVRHGPTACPRLRAAVGGAALVGTLLLVTRSVTAAGDEATRSALLAGVTATLLQALGLLRWPRLTAPAASVLGVLALVTLLPTRNQALATEMAVLFLATTELAGWAANLRSVIPETSASIARQLGQIGAVVAVGGITTAVIARAAGSEGIGPHGRAALVVGLVAAVIPVGLLASRRWRSAV